MQHQFIITFTRLPKNELNEADTKLMHEAFAALEKSYSPYSNFQVGCAVMMEGGKMVSGSNQEVASYPVCICAEGVALSTASSLYPKEKILTIFIVAKNATGIVQDMIAPCGVCRQRLVEYEMRQQSDIKILLNENDETVVKFHSCKSILPFAFGAAHLPLKP